MQFHFQRGEGRESGPNKSKKWFQRSIDSPEKRDKMASGASAVCHLRLKGKVKNHTFLSLLLLLSPAWVHHSMNIFFFCSLHQHNHHYDVILTLGNLIALYKKHTWNTFATKNVTRLIFATEGFSILSEIFNQVFFHDCVRKKKTSNWVKLLDECKRSMQRGKFCKSRKKGIVLNFTFIKNIFLPVNRKWRERKKEREKTRSRWKEKESHFFFFSPPTWKMWKHSSHCWPHINSPGQEKRAF